MLHGHNSNLVLLSEREKEREKEREIEREREMYRTYIKLVLFQKILNKLNVFLFKVIAVL